MQPTELTQVKEPDRFKASAAALARSEAYFKAIVSDAVMVILRWLSSTAAAASPSESQRDSSRPFRRLSIPAWAWDYQSAGRSLLHMADNWTFITTKSAGQRSSLGYRRRREEIRMDKEQTVFIVDDDEGVREGLSLLLESVGQRCELYSSAFEFLEAYDKRKGGCLVLDIRMPRMSGLNLQAKLNGIGSLLPIIFITGHGDIPMAVEAMRRGALDFIRKPFREQDLLYRINEALEFEV
jgi:CheY-like chemotaxis protein